MNEASELNRSVRLLLEPNGSFELSVGDPKGFRTTGQMALVSDGSLVYQYNEMVGQGRARGGSAPDRGGSTRATAGVQSS